MNGGTGASTAGTREHHALSCLTVIGGEVAQLGQAPGSAALHARMSAPRSGMSVVGGHAQQAEGQRDASWEEQQEHDQRRARPAQSCSGASSGITRAPRRSARWTCPASSRMSVSSAGEVASTDAEAAAHEALLIDAALLACEQAGVARWCPGETVAYLKVRRTAAGCSGGFHALKHRLADLYAEVESAGRWRGTSPPRSPRARTSPSRRGLLRRTAAT